MKTLDVRYPEEHVVRMVEYVAEKPMDNLAFLVASHAGYLCHVLQGIPILSQMVANELKIRIVPTLIIHLETGL